MTRAEAFLYRLAAGLPASADVVIVSAHPDDETVGVGGSLGLCLAATVVQVTNGAHPDPEQWRRAGLTTQAAYQAMRNGERRAAWQAAGWTAPVIECDVPDRHAHDHLSLIIDRLVTVLASASVVMTHPYEGGHPDHDAVAFAVQTACDRLGSSAPERVEFASYHWDGARRVVGSFWRDPSVREWRVPILGARLAQKQRALAAYVSQARILTRWNVADERYRLAPRYDFTKQPPPPLCLYDRKAWPISNASLRAAMARAA